MDANGSKVLVVGAPRGTCPQFIVSRIRQSWPTRQRSWRSDAMRPVRHSALAEQTDFMGVKRSMK